MLPNFLIVGAQKSGTTTLWSACDRHPDIFMAPARETGFFFNDATFNNGPAFYETNFFHGWSGEAAVGEKTPEYLLFPGTAARIRAVLGADVRLIALVRNPAERAHSGWRHNLMMGWESLPFADALAAEPERIAANRFALGRFGYLARGFYAKQLAEYFDCFDREQIKIVLFDDLIRDQQGTLDEIFRFLGVAPVVFEKPIHDGRPKVEPFVMEGAGADMVLHFRGRSIRHPSAQLRSFAERYNRTLEEAGRLAAGEAVRINNEIFGEDIAALSQIIGRNLDHWLTADDDILRARS